MEDNLPNFLDVRNKNDNFILFITYYYRKQKKKVTPYPQSITQTMKQKMKICIIFKTQYLNHKIT